MYYKICFDIISVHGNKKMRSKFAESSFTEIPISVITNRMVFEARVEKFSHVTNLTLWK